MPSSLATIAAWDKGAPTSVMIAAARGKRGVHPRLVLVALENNHTYHHKDDY
ncbi:MAG: hypothetical protein PHG06_11345 [Parabacteroides sp.]|nr:hypothetical protein [Parabacteroides sp.]